MTPPPDVDGPPPAEDWAARLRRQLAARQARRDRQAAERAEFAQRRQHGLAARHNAKLTRQQTADTTSCATSADRPAEEATVIIPVSKKPLDDAPGTGGRNRPERITTCSIVNILTGNRCTGEALDVEADPLICLPHAARVMAMINARTGGPQ
jgi:hypothetical protein